MPALSFKYPSCAFAVDVSTEGYGSSQPLMSAGDDKNRLLHLPSTEMMSDDMRFEAGAGLPVPCRASAVRIVFFKLLGTGVLAAISGVIADNKEAGLSCAFAAAINTVACAFYVLIWSIRAQNFGSTHAYGSYMLKVGRSGNYKEEQAANAEKLFAQETSVDGLRYVPLLFALLHQCRVMSSSNLCVCPDALPLSGIATGLYVPHPTPCPFPSLECGLVHHLTGTLLRSARCP